jgi:glutathione S-transferase
MMTLYYSMGACSFAPHVVLNELGLPFKLVKIDNKTKQTADGQDFLKINPKGYVPALQLDDGSVLTEGVAIMQYLADQKPESGLAPKLGSMERYRLMEMLNYITTELHKGFGNLFGADNMVKNPEGNTELRAAAKAGLLKRFSFINDILAKQPFLLGEKMTVADAYLLTVCRWAGYHKLDLSSLTHLTTFMGRMHDRPSVQAAIKAEGMKA